MGLLAAFVAPAAAAGDPIQVLIDDFRGLFNASLAVATDFIDGVVLTGTITYTLSSTANHIDLESSASADSKAEAQLPFLVDPSKSCFFNSKMQKLNTTFGQWYMGIYDTQFPVDTTNGFGFQAHHDDTNIQATSADGTTATSTDTGVANTQNERHWFLAYTDGTSIFFFIDGVSVATHTTNMPLTATASFRAMGRNTSAAAGRGMRLILPVSIGGADF